LSRERSRPTGPTEDAATDAAVVAAVEGTEDGAAKGGVDVAVEGAGNVAAELGGAFFVGAGEADG
jgi:hypothetical protein